MAASPDAHGYEFGPYRIDTAERLLHCEGELVPLPPKAVDTLLALLANAGRMVDKADLMQTVWPDTYIEEGALARNIHLLRKTLGDTPEGERFIETIPKRGYRFVAPVRPIGTAQPPPERPRLSWRTAAIVAASLAAAGLVVYLLWPRDKADPASASLPADALAVLPFRNVSNDPAQEYFAEGLTQAIITDLAKLGKLRVISLGSGSGVAGEKAALEPLQRDASVRRLMRGSVFRWGERVRIDVQLLVPKTRTVLWAKSYEREAADLLALLSSVADEITAEIQVGINARESERLKQRRQIKPAAMDAYLRGRYAWERRTEDSLRQAARYFEQAIALEPAFAPAYCGLADSYSLLGSVGIDGMPPHEAMPRAREYALKALALDPGLAEAHVSLAYVKLSYEWDLAGAASEFSRALSLNPAAPTAHHWYAHYFLAKGDLKRAAGEMDTARGLAPLSAIINVGVGWCLYYARQFDAAIAQYRSILEMEPNFALAHHTLGMAYLQKSLHTEAIQEFRQAAALSGNTPSAIEALAAAHAAAGRESEARAELARLEAMSRQRYVPAFYFAALHNDLGNTAAAVPWIWKAVGERSDYLMYLRLEPRASRVLTHPEFLKVLGRLHP